MDTPAGSQINSAAGLPMFMTPDGENVRCDLCLKSCIIKTGNFGSCGVRGNKGGKGIIPYYGLVSALAVDPVEKKPLYHFKPGSKIFSLGFAGCNLRCPFCQNWQISQINQRSQKTDISDLGRRMQSGEIISAALRQDSPSIAYTYSEPLVHIEYILDCMALARRHGIANVLVTNGCIKPEAAAAVLKLTDAANVDLKCFSADTYKNCLGGDLEAVLDFIRLCRKMNVHIEITTLVVPDLNDSSDELNAAADFIASVDKDIPWFLSAYHPDYRWNAPPTDPVFLLRTAIEAGKKLTFVYTGNFLSDNNTHCAFCGAVLVKRRGYNTDTSGLINNKCAACGKIKGIII